MANKISKIQLVLIGAILTVIAAIVVYAIFKKQGIEFPFGKFILWISIFAAGIAAVGVAVWWAVSISDGNKNDQSNIPKKYVDTSKAIDVWKEAFIINTKIPYIIERWNDDKIVSVNPTAVQILNEKSFPEPSGQTSDLFCGFEVIASEGERRGTMVVLIRLDLGEEWIRNNWNWRIRQDRCWETFDLELPKYPLATSKDEQVRLTIKRMEMAEDDYDEPYLRTTIDPLIKQSQMSPKKTEREKSPIKVPNLIEQFPELSEDGEKDDDDDLINDMRAYRNKNK